MDIAAMVGSMFGGSLVLGWIIHLMMGTVLWAEVYAYIAEPQLGGAPWVRGLSYGFLWLSVTVPLYAEGRRLPRAGRRGLDRAPR